MRFIASVLIVALGVILMLPLCNAIAGDEEWATVGKILTGVVAADVIHRALEPNRGYYERGYYYNPGYIETDTEYVVERYRVRPRRRRSRYYRGSSTIIEERTEREIVPIIE